MRTIGISLVFFTRGREFVGFKSGFTALEELEYGAIPVLSRGYTYSWRVQLQEGPAITVGNVLHAEL